MGKLKGVVDLVWDLTARDLISIMMMMMIGKIRIEGFGCASIILSTLHIKINFISPQPVEVGPVICLILQTEKTEAQRGSVICSRSQRGFCNLLKVTKLAWHEFRHELVSSS